MKICIRNGYTIADGSMADTIDLLRLFGKDTNGQYVRPSDLKPNMTDLCTSATRR